MLTSSIAGIIICALMAGLPLVTRGGLSLLILAAGLLWLIWALRTPAGGLGPINGWLLLLLGIAVVATGCSPVPVAAFKGLLKLVSYLGVYALMRQLLAEAPQWWNRIVAALLAGQLVSAVLAIRQLYGDTAELARWADPNSVADGTIRVYGPLENPNLLAGYLIPILPIAVVALLRWRSWPQRLFAGCALLLGAIALFLSYSRGGWLGMLAALGGLALLLVLRQTRQWPPLWRRRGKAGPTGAGGPPAAPRHSAAAPIGPPRGRPPGHPLRCHPHHPPPLHSSRPSRAS